MSAWLLFGSIASQGSGRFRRLRQAVDNGQASPPIDARYLERPLERLDVESSRAQVVTFLEGLYNSVAETLPDVKDDPEEITFEGHAGNDPPDSYVEALNKEDLVTVTAPRGGKKRIRTKIKSVKITEGRHPQQSGLEIRFLPPGHIKDYWEQLRAAGFRFREEHFIFVFLEGFSLASGLVYNFRNL